MIPLPKPGKAPLKHGYFPTAHQEFIFRASEFVSFEKIAEVLETDAANVTECARQMGIDHAENSRIWLEKGYISIIRAMWHVLPYSQLTKLLEIDEERLGILLREEDFLDVKLKDKPVCEPVRFRELTEEEKTATEFIRETLSTVSEEGVRPFDFRFSAPKVRFSGKEVFKSRIIYLFSGLYQTAFDADSESFCSDAMLESYRDLGINGVWTQGILYQLTEFPFEPSLSRGWQKRQENLRRFTERLAAYGIKLYLYLNEPRCMPASFFEKYPDLAGYALSEAKQCMCTSAPGVQEYLKNAVASVCAAAPLLGGFFTITRSENPTNCYSHSNPDTCTCPRCRKRTVGEVIGELMGVIREGIDRVDPQMKLFAWSWGWSSHWEDVIRHLPGSVILMSQSELKVPYEIAGVKGEVVDYSMGRIGPGEQAKSEWALAKSLGLETAAKVQVNTTWEGSTVPALPVTPLVEKHVRGIRDENVSHLLLSWTLGGYPSANLAAAAKYFYEKALLPPVSPAEEKALEIFSRAFLEFPFSLRVLYGGPQNAGPATLLYEEPTGYKATMTCFAYDDLESWRGPYSEDAFESQFKKLCGLWEEGLELIKDEETETSVMAKAAYCLYRSSLDLIRFVRARGRGDRAAMKEIAFSEEKRARDMLDCMKKNAAIGFEAANHYYFTKRSMTEKILCCRRLQRIL